MIKYDPIWGPSICPEFIHRFEFTKYVRIKPWEALPLPEKIRFLNMRRQNKPYDKCIAKQVIDKNIVFEGRKCYRIL